MSDDAWSGLADQFADEAYDSVKGYVRTYVLHRQPLEHLPSPRRPCSTSRATNRFRWSELVTT